MGIVDWGQIAAILTIVIAISKMVSDYATLKKDVQANKEKSEREIFHLREVFEKEIAQIIRDREERIRIMYGDIADLKGIQEKHHDEIMEHIISLTKQVTEINSTFREYRRKRTVKNDET